MLQHVSLTILPLAHTEDKYCDFVAEIVPVDRKLHLVGQQYCIGLLPNHIDRMRLLVLGMENLCELDKLIAIHQIY